MRQKYRLFLRGTVYSVQDNVTGKQETLATKDRTETGRLFNAKNEASRTAHHQHADRPCVSARGRSRSRQADLAVRHGGNLTEEKLALAASPCTFTFLAPP